MDIKEGTLKLILGKNPYLMKGTGFTRQVENGASMKWVWILEKLESMPLVDLTVLYQDLCLKDEYHASTEIFKQPVRRNTFRRKLSVSRTPYSKDDSFEAQYLMEPVKVIEAPNCNRINCPVLTEKEFKNADGSRDMLPFCGMYSKYLRSDKNNVITPCGACLRERRSLWES